MGTQHLAKLESSKTIDEEADHDAGKWKEAEGLKFKPTDGVLAENYLSGKVSGRTDGKIFPLIKEIDVYQHEPEKLESIAHKFGDGNMYFFSVAQRKYRNGSNIDRNAKGGSWWPCKSCDVYGTTNDKQPIAKKRSLTYFRNDPKSGKPTIKTQWLMKEYMLLDQGPINEEEPIMTLCVIYYKENKRKQRESDKELEAGSSAAAAQTETKDLNMSTSHDEINLDNSRKRHCPSSCSSLNKTLGQILSLPNYSQTVQGLEFNYQFINELPIDPHPQALGNTITNPDLLVQTLHSQTVQESDEFSYQFIDELPIDPHSQALGNTITNPDLLVQTLPSQTVQESDEFSYQFINELPIDPHSQALGYTITNPDLLVQTLPSSDHATATADSNAFHKPVSELDQEKYLSPTVLQESDKLDPQAQPNVIPSQIGYPDLLVQSMSTMSVNHNQDPSCSLNPEETLRWC